MQFIRKHRKASIIVLLVLIFGMIASFTFARYIYNVVYDYILETKGFYFNSSILTVNNKSYKINNWDGVNAYPLMIDLIRVECSSNVTCSLSKESGVIDTVSENDSYTITVTPVAEFDENDVATVRTYATSTSPYKQTLSATYVIGVVKSKFTYNIEDSPNDLFFTLNLTNSVAYYKVEEAFGDYEIGDSVSLEAYEALSDIDKAKCYSAKITVTFDPNVAYLDMTAKPYLHRLTGSEQTVTIDGYQYVTKFTFKVDATSSEKIIFYKADKTQNYTYPIVNEDAIIDVDIDLVE